MLTRLERGTGLDWKMNGTAHLKQRPADLIGYSLLCFYEVCELDRLVCERHCDAPALKLKLNLPWPAVKTGQAVHGAETFSERTD
jgi:hypothetical protein